MTETRPDLDSNKGPIETHTQLGARLLLEHQDSAVSIENNLLGLIGTSEGSGAFVGADKGARGNCEIATDNHVVDMSWHTHEIKLANGESYNASVVFRDLANDLAVLRVYGVADPQKTCKPVTLEEAEHPLNPKDTTVLLGARLEFSDDDIFDPNRLHREMRLPADIVGTVFKYAPTNIGLVSDWKDGEVRNRESLFVTERAYHGDSGAAVLSAETGKAVGFVDRGGPGAFTQVTPSSFLRKDLDELHRRDAEEEKALRETLPIPPLL